MSFVKCEAVQIPKKSMRQHMDNDHSERIKSDADVFQDYVNPSPLFDTNDK